MESIKGRAAITGLGITDMGRIYGHDSNWFAGEAVRMAVEDAGLSKDDIDGLLINAGVTGNQPSGLSLGLQNYLGLTKLRLLNHMNAAGSTAAQMVTYAAFAVTYGLANHVVCVFADAPLSQNRSAGAAYARTGGGPAGMASLPPAYGSFGTNIGYAMAARRHMALYGTTQDQLGQIAVSTRLWATMNPKAQMREPISLEDYHASRWIVEPLHLLDCCLVSNGAVAVIVSSAERARDMKQPPVYVWGVGQGHHGNPGRAGWEGETNTAATIAKEAAFRMAGIGVEDVNICEIYDCYTYTVLVTLEDYGFCKKGEGGAFVEDGKLGPGGALPVNTGGGQLSGYYMWGMTPVSEAVIQTRGEGGERQVEKHDVVLVTGNGGILNYHGCLVLSPHPA
ncbi:MAG TPA: thiolase family protein [Dehalococcoidia bacterium]|nr:thiolase family protein [Dehalococcoidia bacterium]